MMDELELLKKDWQKKEEHLPKLSYNDIYTMIWKKSSSIVKWIFYISIIELAFWIFVNLTPFYLDEYQTKLNELDIGYSNVFLIVSSIITYSVILVFIYLLYKAYKGISVADNVKTLMESILKTRKIVKYYVIYNLVVMFLVTVYTIFIAFTKDERMTTLLNKLSEDGSELKIWLVVALFTVLALAVTLGFIWVFYQLIYGFLLKRLNRNYKELKRLEM